MKRKGIKMEARYNSCDTEGEPGTKPSRIMSINEGKKKLPCLRNSSSNISSVAQSDMSQKQLTPYDDNVHDSHSLKTKDFESPMSLPRTKHHLSLHETKKRPYSTSSSVELTHASYDLSADKRKKKRIKRSDVPEIQMPCVSTEETSDLKIYECPLPPLQAPLTVAHLRVLLLVGFISFEALSNKRTELNVAFDKHLCFPLPIHSARVTNILRRYLSDFCHCPYISISGIRYGLIARELQLMSLGFSDVFCGPVSSLFKLDIIDKDSVVVNSVDFQRCDRVLRTVLNSEHFSNAILLWEPSPTRIPKWPLPLGAGLGVETVYSRESSTTTFRKSDNHYPLRSAVGPPPFKTEQIVSLPKRVINDIPPYMMPVKMIPPHHNVNQERFPMMNQSLSLPIQRPTSHTPNLPLSETQSLEDMLNAPSAIERQQLESGAELRQLLTVPTTKHSMTTRAFQNQGGSRVQQICRHGTRYDCIEAQVEEFTKNPNCHPETPIKACPLIHFRRIMLPHTDISLGDCSYLDTCRHMSSCRFVHYEVDLDVGSDAQKSELLERSELKNVTNTFTHTIGTVFSGNLEIVPAQWIDCDVRTFDFNVIRGKIKVVMADPPWDIHMDLPYGTMTDTEMRTLRVDLIQDEGCLFLWVTGRAMELGRECMKLWGYEMVEEIVWVKTNQLHRLIRTGRTGHWLNHSKEHCLVGIKGSPKLNHHLDTDIIVAEVRETSRKPDEIYRIIERLCPGPYKLELFGRQHNVRENWITLGNQLDNISLHDTDIIQKYNDFASKT